MALLSLHLSLLLSSLLLVSAEDAAFLRGHAVLRSACASTLYPDLCVSSFGAHPSRVSSLTDLKSVVHGVISLTESAVYHSSSQVKNLTSSMGDKLTAREHGALTDCLETFSEAISELIKTDADLSFYNPNKTSEALSKHASDLKTLLSAAMTNHDSCLDGLSYSDAKYLKEEIAEAVKKASNLCSNVLAMVSSMTESDIAARLVDEKKQKSFNRKLLQNQEFEVDDEGFPRWMTAADRRLLQGTVNPDVTVAADGSGNFKSISAAAAAAPGGKRFVIRIKAGTYRENVVVSKSNVMFVGDGAGATVITGSRNVVDGSTTFNSATVAITGGGFLARDLTIQNTAGPAKHQAVALRVGSDLSAFYRCEFLGYQDTLYVYSLRQFYRDCTIAGTVDFIFGNAAVVFQNCNIQLRTPMSNQKNTVTAQGRDDPNQNTGISIQRCSISGSFPRSYLGRPWRRYSRTVVMQSSISGAIVPAGWLEWSGNFALDTLTYREYQNTGAGADTSGRVKWKGFKVINSASEAQQYTVGNFIGGSGWLGATGFPFSLGL